MTNSQWKIGGRKITEWNKTMNRGIIAYIDLT